MLDVQNIVKRYGQHVAVDHISFSVTENQVFGLLGPNGAGKSTTMNIITGALAATEGTVVINGYDIYSDAKKAKQCIGYLPEIPPLYPEFTIREYLNFVAAAREVPARERTRHIARVMERVNVTDVQNRLIKNLSKGYRQRVGMAQAIIGNPDIIVLDEPTVGMDPQQILDIRELIQELGEQHIVVYSSHILSEISNVCSQIMVIARGHIVAYDTPENMSARVMGREQYRLTVLKEQETLAEQTLRLLENVIQIVSKSEERGGTVFTLEARQETNAYEVIFRALQETNCAIKGLESYHPSLEDAFLKIINYQQSQQKELEL